MLCPELIASLKAPAPRAKSPLTTSPPAKRIVLGPGVSDATTRLEGGFVVNLYRLTADHKECVRRPYTLTFHDRHLYWTTSSGASSASGSGQGKEKRELSPTQRIPISEITHLYFGAQTKAFSFVLAATNSGASAAAGGALKPELCFSLLTPKLTLDVETTNKVRVCCLLSAVCILSLVCVSGVYWMR